jgi:hypothetical protein
MTSSSSTTSKMKKMIHRPPARHWHERHTLEIWRDDAQASETLDPLKPKVVERSTAGDHVLDGWLRDEDVVELEQLESRERKVGGGSHLV